MNHSQQCPESELQQHQEANVPLGGIAWPGRVVLSQSSFGTAVCGIFSRSHHNLCSSNPNMVRFKLALVEWKPWQAQEVLTKGKCPWRVWCEGEVKGLGWVWASARPVPAYPALSLGCGTWFREVLSASDSCGYAVCLRAFFTAVKYTFPEVQKNPNKLPLISQEKL